MTEQEKEVYFDELDKRITEITEESALEEGENGYISRGLFSTVAGGGGPALFETAFYDLWEDLPMIEIQVTPQFVIEDACIEDMVKLTTNFNFTVPLGAFGVHFETKRLFFRYVFCPDAEKDAEEIAAHTIVLYEKLAIILGNVYEVLENIATGKSTFEQEADKNELLRQ